MDWTPEQLAKARALLAEDSAILVQKQTVAYAAGARDAAGRRRQKIVRQWPKISDGDRALCDAYLREYASADNAAPGRIVHGPKADRETYAGDWRMTRTDLSRLKTDPREQGVYQTLVFPADASDGPDGGWHSEETHLNHAHTEVSTGDAPAELDCAVPPPRTRLSVNARLDRETGEWESEKRTDMARGKRWTYTDGDALATTTHTREEHADAPPSVPAPVPGKIVRADADFDEYGTYRTRVDETTANAKSTGPYTASQNALQSTTEESVRNAQKAPSADDNETVNAHINEFGLVDFNKRKTTPKPKTISYTSQNSALESTTTESGRNAEQAPNAGDNEAVNAHVNELGKVDYEKRTVTPKEKQESFQSHKTDLETVQTTVGRNAGAAPAAGNNETVSAHINEYGKIDFEKRSVTPLEKTTNFKSHGTDLEDVTTEIGVNAGAAPSAGDNETVSAHFTELGKVNYEKRSVVPKEKSVTFTSQQTALQSIETTLARNAGTAPSAPDKGSVHANINEYGKVDYELRRVTPTQKTENFTSHKTALETVTTEIGVNAASAPSAADNESVSAHINELGLVNYEKRSVGPVEKSITFTSENNDEREVKTTVGVNAKKAPDAAKNQSVSARINEYGLVNYETHTYDNKGSLGEGTGGVVYYGDWQRGTRTKTTVSSSKGWKKILVATGLWRMKYTMTVKKFKSATAAYGFLAGKTNVHSAHVSQGGVGIWYAHLVQGEKEWKS